MTRQRRTWGSVTRYSAGWRVRAGDDERTTVGLYLDADFGGDKSRSLDAAEEALAEAHRAWRAEHRPSKGRGITLVDFGRRTLARWEDQETRRAIVSDWDRFEKHIARAPFAADPLVSLEHRQIQRWVRSLAAGVAEGPRGDGSRKRSRRTVLNVLNLLRSLIRAAIEEEILDESPAASIVVPRGTATAEDFLLLEQPEAELVLTAQPSELVSLRQITAFRLALLTGMRPGELWGLRWADLGHGEIVVRYNRARATKGGRVRRVPLLEPARAALSEYRAAVSFFNDREPKPHELVFPGESGRPFAEGYDMGWGRSVQGRKDARRWMLGARWQLGLRRPIPLKDLRHTCACALLRGWWVARGWIERPLSMVEIAAWLGHQSITTTERHYARLAPGGLLDVVPRKEG